MASKVIIVGAGVAGLSAALECQERGVEPLVLESSERPGGKLGSEVHGGFLTERAALGLLDRTGELKTLCSKLGIEVLPAGPGATHRWLEREGRVHALPRGPFELVRTSLLGAGEKLGLLAEPLRSRAPDGATVSQFFAHRLGPAGRFLGDAIQSGIHAGDPDRLEMRSAFPALQAIEEKHGSLFRGLLSGPRQRPRLSSFRGGMQELVDALARRAKPHLSAKVLAIRRSEEGYRLQVEGEGILAEVTAERLLLALPAPFAANILKTLDPELSNRLEEFRAVPMVLVHLAVRPEDVSPLHQGFGLLRPGRPVVGALFPGALWPGRAPEGRVLLTALVGGARFLEAVSTPDAQLVQLVHDELRLPRPAETLQVVRWAQAIPQYEQGHAARIAELERLLSRHRGLALAGAWYRGVGVLDCLRDGRKMAELLLI
jgi:oxygen-dependent protoporphyrinogen oxidase